MAVTNALLDAKTHNNYLYINNYEHDKYVKPYG